MGFGPYSSHVLKSFFWFKHFAIPPVVTFSSLQSLLSLTLIMQFSLAIMLAVVSVAVHALPGSASTQFSEVSFHVYHRHACIWDRLTNYTFRSTQKVDTASKLVV
jgi:hypothetical protein